VKGLKLLVPDNFIEFGKKVEGHLRVIRNNNNSYIAQTSLPRFNNGEAKGILRESVRGNDVYILSDVGNYDITFKAQNRIHYMMPDEHYQDIKRLIMATCGHASKLTVVMPYLYGSRQDKRSDRESLDCAVALQELHNLGVTNFLTFDAHNPAVQNAIPTTSFNNAYPTDDLLYSILKNESIDPDNLMVIGPDEGSIKRARFFSDVMGGIDIGNFYKQRDYSKIVDGMNPIKDHKFLGPRDLTGKDAIVVDDMIASGGSLLDAAKRLKERNCNRIYFVVTFALFTEGIEKFEKAYEEGLFDKVYATNLTYVPEEIKNKDWYRDVDCSLKMASIIDQLNKDDSIKQILKSDSETVHQIQKMLKR